MGDQLRFTPDGPRELEESDFRPDGKEPGVNKPKVIRNSDASRITTAAKFDPPVDTERHRKLLAKMEVQAGTQRGKPRSRDPAKNPLGGRVFDMNCGWPLYRQPNGRSFQYLCGLYQQSHGAQCNHNRVAGEATSRFMLSCIRQRALSPERLKKLETRIRQLAAADQQEKRLEEDSARNRAKLSDVEPQLGQVSQNLARAKSDEQYKAVVTVFEQVSEQAKQLRSEIAAATAQPKTDSDADTAVSVAMEVVHELTELARDSENLGSSSR